MNRTECTNNNTDYFIGVSFLSVLAGKRYALNFRYVLRLLSGDFSNIVVFSKLIESVLLGVELPVGEPESYSTHNSDDYEVWMSVWI